MSPTVYLKNQLNFKLAEFMNLSDADKEWYRNAAREEMTALGIAIKE